MRGVWLRSHTLQLIINMQSLLALPQSSLQSELLIRLIKLYQISQGRSSLMLMRQPKQTPAPPLMKAAACLRSEGARAHNKRARPLGGAAAQAQLWGPSRGSASSPPGSSCNRDSHPGTIPFTRELGVLGAWVGGQRQGPEHLPPLHRKPGHAPKIQTSCRVPSLPLPHNGPRRPGLCLLLNTRTHHTLSLPLSIVLLAREARLGPESSPSHCWPGLHLPWRPSAPTGGQAGSSLCYQPARWILQLPTYCST